jgi:hypothetical protein
MFPAALIGAITILASSAFAEEQRQMPMMGYGMGQGMMGPGMGMMGPGGMGMMGPGMHGMMGPGNFDFRPMMEGRLAYLKAELAITDAQTAAWEGYVDAVKGRVSAMQNVHSTMMQAMQSGSALERLDARINAMTTMVDSLKSMRPAIETLYNALSDDQKKKADILIGTGCCMM